MLVIAHLGPWQTRETDQTIINEIAEQMKRMKSDEGAGDSGAVKGGEMYTLEGNRVKKWPEGQAMGPRNT